MKRKTLRKAVAVAAAAVMAMGTLAGCGSSNTAESTAAAETTESTASSEAAESTAAGETTETASTSTGGGMDSWEPFAENVTLQVPVYDRGVERLPAAEAVIQQKAQRLRKQLKARLLLKQQKALLQEKRQKPHPRPRAAEWTAGSRLQRM